MVQFNYHLFDKSNQDSITTEKNIRILIFPLIYKKLIYFILKTIWDHKYGCEYQYHSAFVIYILSFIVLEFYIIIEK